MLRIFDQFLKQFIMREVIVFLKLFKSICLLLLVAHFSACLWYFIGNETSPSWIDEQDLRHDDSTTFTKYSFAWYWAVVTLFTTGYGDIAATNTVERWVCSCCIVIGTCMFAYFIGTLTVLISEGDKINSYETEKLDEAKSFCETKKLPKELTHCILTHVRYHCRYNYVFDESELLNILPSYLQHDIHCYVSKQFLLNLKIFQNDYIHLPDFIIGLIAVKSKSVSCNQSYRLYDIGDIAKQFYIQRTGKSIMYNKNGKILQQLTRGNVIGEYSSILFKKRINQVQCETWSEFYSINVDDIKEILSLYYPKTSDIKWKRICKYLKDAYISNVTHSVHINEHHRQTNHVHDDTLQNLQSHEESVHLFDNSKTGRVNKHATPNEVNVDFTLHIQEETPNAASPIIPHSVDSDNEDVSYSQLINTEKFRKNKSIRSNSNDVNVKLNEIDKAQHKGSQLPKFTKFHIRSNSVLRNTVVVAHSEKHNKSNKSNKLDVPLQSETKEMKSTEMVVIKNILPRNSSAYDSECSFSSMFSDSDGDKYDRPKIKNMKKQMQRVKKKKIGKHNTGYKTGHKMKRKRKLKVIVDNHNHSTDDKKIVKDTIYTNDIKSPDSLLLAPLTTKYQTNGNNIITPLDDTCIGYNELIVTNMEKT